MDEQESERKPLRPVRPDELAWHDQRKATVRGEVAIVAENYRSFREAHGLDVGLMMLDLWIFENYDATMLSAMVAVFTQDNNGGFSVF